MLTSKDTFKDLEVIAKVREGLTSEFEKASLKLQELTIKLMLSIRSNQTAIMKHEGIALKEPEEKTEEAK